MRAPYGCGEKFALFVGAIHESPVCTAICDDGGRIVMRPYGYGDIPST